MKKLFFIIISLMFALLFSCNDGDSTDTLSGLDKVNADADSFITDNDIQLPLSVSLDEIDSLSDEDFSDFGITDTSGSTLAEATASGAIGTSDGDVVSVGINLSSSLAASRAFIESLFPQALVIDSAGARLVDLIYNEITGLYSADITLAQGINYICVIIFKDDAEWRKTTFLMLTFDGTPADTTSPILSGVTTGTIIDTEYIEATSNEAGSIYVVAEVTAAVLTDIQTAASTNGLSTSCTANI